MTEWRPVIGHPHYEVSDDGQVRSLDRLVVNSVGAQKRLRGVRLKPTATKAGPGKFYHRVRIDGRNRSLAALLLEAFVGPRPPGQMARHLNDDSLDDRLVNLAWGTRLENARDSVRNGRSTKRLPNEVTEDIRAAYLGGESQRSIARRYGVSQHSVYRRLKRSVLAVLVAVPMGMITSTPPDAHAQPGVGCQTDRWGFLGGQRRTICDTPKRPDGSWTRSREIWVPAGYVPSTTSCGTYFCSSSGGYYRERGTVAYEEYVVFDSNVLPDEPGWLPTGSVVIR